MFVNKSFTIWLESINSMLYLLRLVIQYDY